MNVIDCDVPYPISLEEAKRVSLANIGTLPRPGRHTLVLADTIPLPRDLANGTTITEQHDREVYLTNNNGTFVLRQWIDYKARTS